MGSSRGKWGIGIGGGGKAFKQFGDSLRDQASGVRKAAGRGVGSLLRPFDVKKWKLDVNLPKVDLQSMREQARVQYATFMDNTDEKTRFYSSILLPTLIANYFFGRYFGPMTAFLTQMQGVQLYTPTWYKYEKGVVKFDDTILTYGTDYLIAGFMAYLAGTIFRTKQVDLNKPLVGWSMALLLLYSASTLSGAICHNFLSDIDSMNTITFRMLWRICVCTVGAAGGVLGAVASVVAGLPVEDEKTKLFSVPVVPNFFWISWSVFFTLVIWVGLYSMTTPACDIFLAGVTQTVPHAYFMMVTMSKDENHFKRYKISNKTRNILLFGLFLNIPLLPGYDLFSFLKLPLGLTNCVMHGNLALAWGSQGYAMYKMSKGIAASA